jgi:hypothetical protein
MITGMRPVGTVNFDLLVEFDLTVTPEGMPPYPTTRSEGSTAAIWLDLTTLR